MKVSLIGMLIVGAAFVIAAPAPAFAAGAKKTQAACEALATERGFTGGNRANNGRAQFIRDCMSGKQG